MTTLLAFYDFPAERWLHLKTTNPLSSRSESLVTVPTGQRTLCVTREMLLMFPYKFGMAVLVVTRACLPIYL